MRCNPDETIYFRFGQSHGIYFSLQHGATGRLANTLDYDTGDATLVGKLNDGAKVLLGRTSECGIKIMHAIVSRQHMELDLRGNILVVTDLGSTNKSFLHTRTVRIDIEEYAAAHPPEKAKESTLDAIHEAFGPTLDDFLIAYLSERNKNT